MKINKLREQHPQFVYHSYDIKRYKQDLIFKFSFIIKPNIKFSPNIVIKHVSTELLKSIPQHVLNNFAFHLGLAEIPSYWKSTCSPHIIIKAAPLSKRQIDWWNKLLIRGLGEFFFNNKIDFTAANFVSWKSTRPGKIFPLYSKKHPNKTLVPIGGGKDSVVTWQLLKKHNLPITDFALNPSPIVKNLLCKNAITVERQIDPTLLKLNKQGYLNGHTPFSSYLAFLSVVCASIFDFNKVVFSNEQSSNEPNLTYLNYPINHQYSKSFEFESDFRRYCSLYLTNSVDYFSFLRPLYELQISKLFSQYPKYLKLIRSCNNTQTTDWCSQCPKCIFVFSSLYPFIEERKLIAAFGRNIFTNTNLMPTAMDMLGKSNHKPFECVGTYEETTIAFYLCVNKHIKEHKQLPKLLQQIDKRVLSKEKNLKARSSAILKSWNHNHYLPNQFTSILKQEIRNDHQQ